MAESYHSDGRVTGGDRDPLQLRSAAAMLRTLRSDPPGGWGADRHEQVKHFRDVTFIAIRAVMDLVGSASYQVSKRRRPGRGKSTFGPGGTVAKSSSATQAQGRDEDYTPLDDCDHPLCKVVARPNPNEVFGELAAKLVLQNRLTGVGPVWAVPNRAGRPVELYALRTPHLFPAYQATREFPTGAWRVTPQVPGGWSGFLPGGIGASGAVLPNEEVKRFMDPHPLYDWDGYSPLTAGDVHLDVLESVNQSRKSAMDNGLQLDAVIVIPGADQTDLDKITSQLTQKAGGSRNARKVVGFAPPLGMGDGGKSLVQQMGQSPREMDFSQAWEQETRFCLALFGVPASVVDLATSENYSERYAARQQFYDRQSDYLNRFAVWLTKVLCWPWESFPGEYIVHVKPRPIDDKEPPPEQFKRQLEHDLITYNQALAKDDMPPVEGGDVPVKIYLKLLEQKLLGEQQPQPAPQPPAMGESPIAPQPQGGPTAGAVPRPDNPAAEGSKPPAVAKAMSSLSGPDGGFLVPDGVAPVRKRRKKLRRCLDRVLKSLGDDPPAPHAPARFDLPPVVNVLVPRQETPTVNVNVPRQESPTVNVSVPRQEPAVVNLTVDPPPTPRVVTRTAKRGDDGTWTVTESEGT